MGFHRTESVRRNLDVAWSGPSTGGVSGLRCSPIPDWELGQRGISLVTQHILSTPTLCLLGLNCLVEPQITQPRLVCGVKVSALTEMDSASCSITTVVSERPASQSDHCLGNGSHLLSTGVIRLTVHCAIIHLGIGLWSTLAAHGTPAPQLC